jgi:hypothetical protein
MSRSPLRSLSRPVGAAAAAALALGVVPLGALPAGAADLSQTGRFLAPFEEPGPRCVEDADGRSICKPAGASVVVLPNGKLLYWDALEGMEDPEVNAVAEFGHVAQNDAVRVLDLRGPRPTWARSEVDPVSNPKGIDGEFLPGPLHNNDETRNDGDLFCSDQLLLADGRVLDAGGTAYYQEPGVPGQPTYGVVELEGLKNSRLYDSRTNTWSAGGNMAYGRWYPSLVTLPDNRVLVTSGVTKLIKPVYPNRPTDSGLNVTQSEVYDPRTNAWKVDGGKKSLPLYPRLHLLPNGRVYYDAAGQTFNPAGQAYDEATWNMASVYDPKAGTWRDLGLPEFGYPEASAPLGFRGSAFSQMLPLKAPYDTAQFLSAGGVYGVSPGSYLGTDTSTLNTVKIGADGSEQFSSEAVGALNNPRWYSTGVTLPTGQVLAFNGADRDEVVNPGSGTPVTTPELYDPVSRTWTELAGQTKGRTYHSTAVLLPDARVLVGGHSPIATGYTVQNPALADAAGLSRPEREPSFEVFEPPNLFYGARPVIASVEPAVRRGTTLTIETPDARDVSSVRIVRNTAITHLVDADQRVVDLPVVSRNGSRVVVQVTDKAAVLPDGPYNLFVNKRYAKGETPSVGRQVFVGAVPPGLIDDVRANHDREAATELRARATKSQGKGKAKGRSDGKGGNGLAAPDGTTPVDVPVADATPRLEATPVSRRTGLPVPPVLPVALVGGLVGTAYLVRRRLLRD